MTKRITEEQKKIALGTFEQEGNMVIAAQSAGVSVRTLQREAKRCVAFRKQLDEADILYHEYIKQQIRAATQNPNIKMPQLVSIMFEAKKHMPEYRDKIDHKVDADIKIITGVPRPDNKTNEEGKDNT